jgi:Spy/CpxP family protein refolding chaperone
MTLLVAPASAEDAGGGRHGKGAGMCERLECTDAQRTRIEAIRAEHREETADERAEAKRLHAALKAERSASKPDAEKLARLQSELDALKTGLRQARSESKAEISAVLTAEQRERLGAMKAERKAEHGKDKAHGKREHGKNKVHAKRERGPEGKAQAKRERGPQGKAQAKRERGPQGKAQAKRERGTQGKAQAKRGRGGPRALVAG